MRFYALALLSFSVGLIGGCKNKGCDDCLGGGPERDGRLVADTYSWTCEEPKTGDTWEGVYGFNVVLEYAPDGLTSRALPGEGGCSYGLSMFAQDAGGEGTSIANLEGVPFWNSDDDSGPLSEVTPGYYYDQALTNSYTCSEVEDVIDSGISLSDAGALTGVITPEAGTVGQVELDGDWSDSEGFSWGEEIDIEWETGDDWDETWIQVRRERDSMAYETVTCNATGLDEFVINDDVWDLMDADLNVDTNNVYVAFQNSDTYTTDDGQIIETASRVMHVAVISE